MIRNQFPPRARLETNRDERRIDRLATSWQPVRLGTIAGSLSVQATGTFTFGTYTTGGVAVPTLGIPGVETVTMQPWTDGAGVVYLFQWQPLSSEMMVTDWMGNEIANGTDLSAITAHPYVVYGSSASLRLPGFRSLGVGRVTKVQFETSATIQPDTSNYWTLILFLKQSRPLSPQSVGLALGTFVTNTVGIDANTPISLYSDLTGVIVQDEDTLYLDATPTGNPTALVDAVLWPLVGRDVR